MRYIPIILASFFTFLFAFFALIPSIKFTKSQRNKYPILKRLDGKQIHFLVAAIFCAFIVAFTSGLKDYVAMQPQTEISQGNKEITKSSVEPTLKEEQTSLYNSNVSNTQVIDESLSNSNKVNDTSQKTNLISRNQINTAKKKDYSVTSSKIEPSRTQNSKPQSLVKAKSLISQGKYKEAIIECDRILRINPNNSEALGLKKWAQRQLEILKR